MCMCVCVYVCVCVFVCVCVCACVCCVCVVRFRPIKRLQHMTGQVSIHMLLTDVLIDWVESDGGFVSMHVYFSFHSIADGAALHDFSPPIQD